MAMRRFLKRPEQLELPKPRTHGGARPRAGRPRTKNLHSRLRRPVHVARFPLHVTMRLSWNLPSLRRRTRFVHVKRAFRHGCDRFGMRMCEFSLQDAHIHLIVEASDKRALSRGMQALSVRIARAVNRMLGRHGQVIADRYHARPLRTPTEVRNAVHYVRNNMQKHAAERGVVIDPLAKDPFSSVSAEARWYGDSPTVALPQTWLLRNAPS
jgi:REP element-mobilizing transposase RayT